MLCPILMTLPPNNNRPIECVEKDCAWWNADHNKCSIALLAEQSTFTAGSLDRIAWAQEIIAQNK